MRCALQTPGSVERLRGTGLSESVAHQQSASARNFHGRVVRLDKNIEAGGGHVDFGGHRAVGIDTTPVMGKPATAAIALVKKPGMVCRAARHPLVGTRNRLWKLSGPRSQSPAAGAGARGAQSGCPGPRTLRRCCVMHPGSSGHGAHQYCSEPVTSVGVVRVIASPLPSCPSKFESQHLVPRAEVSTHTCCPLATATVRVPVRPETRDGAGCVVVTLPLPMCPVPQQRTLPLLCTAQVWSAPAPSAITVLTPGTCTGMEKVTVVSKPLSAALLQEALQRALT